MEFVVNQNVWFEGETKFADIVLPACTNLERWDIGEWANCSGYIPDSYTMCNHRVIVLQKKCIEPLGESKSDYQIFAELAKRLGIWEIFTDGGKTEYDWVKQSFAASDLPKRHHLGGVREEGLLRGAAPPGRPRVDARLPLVRRGPAARHSRLGPPPRRHGGAQGPADRRPARSSSSRPASPASRRPTWSTRSARRSARSTSRAGRATTPPSSTAKYPLQMISPHPRFSFHTMGDGKQSWMNEVKDHRVLDADGHYYWIMRLNPGDAAARGIADGDLIRAFNDRGSVILAAQVTERRARRAWCTPTRAAPTTCPWASPAAPPSAPAA